LTMAGIFDVWQPSSVQSFLNLVLIHWVAALSSRQMKSSGIRQSKNAK
jgi:hypothetical protein